MRKVELVSVIELLIDCQRVWASGQFVKDSRLARAKGFVNSLVIARRHKRRIYSHATIDAHEETTADRCRYEHVRMKSMYVAVVEERDNSQHPVLGLEPKGCQAHGMVDIRC